MNIEDRVKALTARAEAIEGKGREIDFTRFEMIWVELVTALGNEDHLHAVLDKLESAIKEVEDDQL